MLKQQRENHNLRDEKEHKEKIMNNKFTDKFISDPKNLEFLNSALWGPNGMRQAEELASHLNIKSNMRVLDLGCGPGLSTLYLVRNHGVEVFAADLYMTPTENLERFIKLGIADKAIPMLVDATKDLPFAERFFDILFSVDAYMHFGFTEGMLAKMASYVKKGGYIAVAIHGLKKDFNGKVPEEMKRFLDNEEAAEQVRGIDWWTDLWSKEAGVEIISISEMKCHKQAWEEYLASRNPNKEDEKWDLDMMEAEGGKYYNTIQLIAKVI